MTLPSSNSRSCTLSKLATGHSFQQARDHLERASAVLQHEPHAQHIRDCLELAIEMTLECTYRRRPECAPLPLSNRRAAPPLIHPVNGDLNC